MAKTDIEDLTVPHRDYDRRLVVTSKADGDGWIVASPQDMGRGGEMVICNRPALRRQQMQAESIPAPQLG